MLIFSFLLGVWIVYCVALLFRSIRLKEWYRRLLEEEVAWLIDHPQYAHKAQALGLLRIESLLARHWELYFKVWLDLEPLEEPVYNYYREDLEII